jgi:hypothetical protein
MDGEINAYNTLTGKPEGKRQLGRPGSKWEVNIIMGLRNSLGGRGLDSSGSGQGPVARPCEHGNKPSVSIKCGEFLE